MKDESFDKEVAALYQQRKSQIVAPNVTLSQPLVKVKYSVFKLFSIFTVGGLASFGILAIVAHLAKKPEEHKQILLNQHQVEIADIPVKTQNTEIMVPKLVLPPKPELPITRVKPNVSKTSKNVLNLSDVNNVELNLIQVVKLPHLKEPKLSIKPVYRVMPKYSFKTMKAQHSGAVRLRYEIDSSGNVKNINIINSEVSKDLQRSAKKALAKWKYNPEDDFLSSYEIIFEFNPDE